MRDPMTRIQIVLVSSLVTLACGARAQAVDLPNIVLIFADDLGYGDTSGCGTTEGSQEVMSGLRKGLRCLTVQSVQWWRLDRRGCRSYTQAQERGLRREGYDFN